MIGFYNFFKRPGNAEKKNPDILRQLQSRIVGDKKIEEFIVRVHKFQTIVFAHVVTKKGEGAREYPVASIIWNSRTKGTPSPKEDEQFVAEKSRYEASINVTVANYSVSAFPDEPTIAALLKKTSALNVAALGDQAYWIVEP